MTSLCAHHDEVVWPGCARARTKRLCYLKHRHGERRRTSGEPRRTMSRGEPQLVRQSERGLDVARPWFDYAHHDEIESISES